MIELLGKDKDDSVKEALAGELDKIIYFYYEVHVKIYIIIMHNTHIVLHTECTTTTIIRYIK